MQTKLFCEEFKGRKAMDPEEFACRVLAGIEASNDGIRLGKSNLLKTLSRAAPRFAVAQMARMTKR